MPWTTPFEELRRTVKALVWVSTVFGIIMILLALGAIGGSAYLAYQRSQDNKANIERNEQTITALCREINAHNEELRAFFLDQKVPFYRLSFLNPHDCSPTRLRRDYGVIQ